MASLPVRARNDPGFADGGSALGDDRPHHVGAAEGERDGPVVIDVAVEKEVCLPPILVAGSHPAHQGDAGIGMRQYSQQPLGVQGEGVGKQEEGVDALRYACQRVPLFRPLVSLEISLGDVCRAKDGSR